MLTLLGRSSIIAILTYWQMQRVRYMFSVQLQAAFTRFNALVKAKVLDASWCPSMVRTVYQTVKGYMAS